ncbi:MAG TPA: DNA repair protein RecO, partial [Flavobacteriaceae bacterium]|nr:DNA repair protein RecO [Flavobacteriaceae bacterium]
MLLTTQAIVITTVKYGEADLIAKCFTESSGIKSYLLKGILKSKKGKLRVSLFQPFTILEIQAYHKDKGTLEYIKEAKIETSLTTIHNTIAKSSIVLFLSESLKNIIREEEKNTPLFDYLKTAIQWLDTHEASPVFHHHFLLHLTKFLGFYPDDMQSEHSYFNAAEGVFQTNDTTVYCFEMGPNHLFKQLLKTPLENLPLLHPKKTERQYTLELLLTYYQLHLHEFKRPKSLAVLQSVFQ